MKRSVCLMTDKLIATFDYIIVRTPPGSPQLRNNPSETLGDGHLEQLDEVFEDSSNTHLRLFDVNRPKTPRRQQLELESISVPEEQWERKSISVPEDAMDNDDYGNLDTLTAKAREWNLKGLGWIEIVDEGKCGPIMGRDLSLIVQGSNPLSKLDILSEAATQILPRDCLYRVLYITHGTGSL